MMLFYVVVGLAVFTGAAAGHLFFRRWGSVAAWIGVLPGMLGGGLLSPIPIHGGVTFLGEVLWEECTAWATSHDARREVRRDAGFRRLLEQRFAASGRMPGTGSRPGPGRAHPVCW